MIGLLTTLLAPAAGAADLEIDGAGATPALTLSGNQVFDNVRIVNGGVLTIGAAGTLTLTADTILVDATSRIDGIGAGTQGVMGAAAPGLGGGGLGAGGGHGGAGSSSFDLTCTNVVGTGGAAFGLATDGIGEPGGAGGGVTDGTLLLAAGGDGGGSLVLDAAIVTILGEIAVDGADGAPAGWGGAGGGGGGSVLITANELHCYGRITATGGDGGLGLSPGGAGGGGLVEQRWDAFGRACPVAVAGGDAACGNGAPGMASALGGFDFDGDGDALIDGDCDPADAGVGVLVAETCDGIDQDCDGLADDGVTCGFNCVAFEADTVDYLSCESDTSATASVTACEGIAGSRWHLAVIGSDTENAAIDTSLTDTENHWIAHVEPVNGEDKWQWDAPVDATFTSWGAGEPNNSGGNEDCTEFINGGDWNDADCAVAHDFLCERCELVTWFVDADGDGYGDPGTASQDCAYNAPVDGVLRAGDCDDASAAVHPAADELCDGIDSDCDGSDDPVSLTVFDDVDNDGYGDALAGPTLLACGAPVPPFTATNANDCDDTRATASPVDVETCNGLDDDCNGIVDDGTVCEGTPEGCRVYHESGVVYLACADLETQPNAEAECAGFGYTLASLASIEEDRVADALVDRVDPTIGFWIGLEDPAAEGLYEWTDGSPFGFENWTYTGEPNNGGGAGQQDCNITSDDDNDEDSWFDRACTDTYYYLCEQSCEARDWYADVDQDGWGDVTDTANACEAPAGYVASPDDCDDLDPLTHPNAGEIGADGTDQDCDGVDACFLDADGDGSGTPDLLADGGAVGCTDLGESDDDLDCDDLDPATFPGASDVAGSGIDLGCDGEFACFYDGDLDGVGGGLAVPSLDPACGTPYHAPAAGDCDDTDPDLSPDAAEVVGDGIDQDCDNRDTCFTDADGDGFGTAVLVDDNALDCDDGGPRSSVGGDCDDAAPGVFPGAAEIPADEIDQDCDGGEECARDADGDGFAGLATIVSADADCDDPFEGTVFGEDCDDGDDTVAPGAAEIPADGLDQDCDLGDTCFDDADGDGFGSGDLVPSADLDCADAGESLTDDDCVPDDPSISPAEAEIPGDGIDNDCDGTALCFLDGDGDGSGTAATIVSADADCDDPDESLDDLDCDDGDPSVGPGAPEVAIDGIDQDCDGGDTCWSDADADGFGAAVPTPSVDLDCADPGESTDTSDCDDSAPDAFPGGVEVVGDGIDQDCDGTENCPVDADGDGAGTPTLAPSLDGDCADPGESTTTDDCDDGVDTIFPGATETVDDGIDQDCDGGDACYEDLDADGFGTDPVPSADLDCLDVAESGTAGDCDDLNPNILPGGIENPADGADSDCDGSELCFLDVDGDGSGTPAGIASVDLDCTDTNESPDDDDCDDGNADIGPDEAEIPGDGIDQDCDGLDTVETDTDTDTDADTDTDTDADTDSDTDTDVPPVVDDRGGATTDAASSGEGCACDTNAPGRGWLGGGGALLALLLRRRAR